MSPRSALMEDDDRFNTALHAEISDETLEQLFRPTCYGELWCRLFGPDWLEAKLTEAFADMSPSAMPHRFRHGPLAEGARMVAMERIYREEKRRRGSDV